MTEIKILPLIGIAIEGITTIKLGEDKAEVVNFLGLPSIEVFNKSFYYDYQFRIDYNEQNKIESIGLFNRASLKRSKLTIYNIDPFSIGAQNLINLLKNENNGNIEVEDPDYYYVFKEISIWILREKTQKNIEKNISKMKKDGEYEDFKDLMEEELEKSKNFYQITICVKNFYKENVQ